MIRCPGMPGQRVRKTGISHLRWSNFREALNIAEKSHFQWTCFRGVRHAYGVHVDSAHFGRSFVFDSSTA
jgi:hypothetical protein